MLGSAAKARGHIVLNEPDVGLHHGAIEHAPRASIRFRGYIGGTVFFPCQPVVQGGLRLPFAGDICQNYEPHYEPLDVRTIFPLGLFGRAASIIANYP